MVRKKSENVFKFKKFAERIQEVDLRKSAFFKIEHANESLDENISYFHQNYQKWSVLNLTEEYAKFQNEIRQIITLPQLLLAKDRVITLLEECLRNATSLSLQPLLEFVVVLAKDLRDDFYPHFPEMFEILVSLLQSHDAQQTEWILVCLAFLFKILKSFIRKDLSNVVNQILPLLDEEKQPDHIINFAVECFSFVARDIKDKNNFILMMLMEAKKDGKYVLGCGKLFFEMLRGLNGQLHSSAEAFLTALLEAFTKSEFYKFADVLYEILVQAFGDLFNYTDIKCIESFWKVLFAGIDKSLNQEGKNMEYLIKLFGQSVEYKEGKKITNLVQTINYVIKIMDCENLEEHVMLNASEIGALILHSNNFNLTQLDASRLSKKILRIDNKAVFEKFVVNSIGYSQFDVLILPDFLKFFENNFDSGSLEILVKIVNQKSYNLNLKKSETVQMIKEIVEKFNLHQEENCEEFLLALKLIPHLVSFKNDGKVQKVLETLISEISSELKSFIVTFEETVIEGRKKVARSNTKISSDNVETKKRLIYLLNEIVGNLKQMDPVKVKEVVDVILPFCADEKYKVVLQILDDLLNMLEGEDHLNLNLFHKIHHYLSDNLMSEYRHTRLNTAKILKKFDHLNIASLVADDDEDRISIYATFHRIEEIDPNVQTYRDQILQLQKLNWDSTYFVKVKDTPYRKDALKYCLGFLNVNFQLLWDPVKELINSYADGFETNEFWGLLKERIEYSVAGCNKSRQLETNPEKSEEDALDSEQEVESDDDSDSEQAEEDQNQAMEITEDNDKLQFLSQSEFLMQTFRSFWESREKVDYIKYRVALWNIVANSNNHLYNDKNHDLVVFFLDFIENEYNYQGEEEKKDVPLARQKLLIAHLTVFSKITCPKHIYKEPEIRKLYMTLILHRNFQVQRLALDCLMHYKEPWLVTYKDLLYNLVNEKTFRNELSTLNLNDKIQEEHREKFIQIFLTILYTKLTTKTVKNDNEGFKQKKEIIVRFLSNLTEAEIVKLTYISVDYLEEHIEHIYQDSKALKSSNFKGSQLQSTLNFIDLIRKNVAGLYSAEYHKLILKIILSISKLAENPHNSQFKNLRQSCLSGVVNFFEQFDLYHWEEQEVNLFFEIFINNQLEKFCSENSQNVTGLMKLFVEWSKNPRYFVLLGRITNENYPLKSIVALLSFKSTSSSVVECVMDIIERLLTLKTDESLNNLSDIHQFAEDGYNYGTLLLKPFVLDILMQLKDFLLTKQNKNINKRNLLILSRITELVSSSESSKILLDILFPLTLKKCQEEVIDSDAVLKLLTTISNLLNIVENSKIYMKQISPLFEHLHEVNLRKFLIKIFNQVFGEEKELMQIINDLNSYDKRWIEQPDHEKRLSVFRKLDGLMVENKIHVDLGILVIYHCFYYLKFEKDLAIRDNASHYLKLVSLNVISKYSKDSQVIDYFVDKIVMNLIQKKLREGKAMQTETISFLGELARKCPEVHPVLKDLHLLTNEKVRDLDFFDNLIHLQKFRHMKALRKFTEISKSLKEVPNLRTLNEILLPISRMFLCNEEYRKKSKIIEAAIEFVGAVCRFLPWNHYEAVLKFYIKKMSFETIYQKQMIRILPAILDSFHFNLKTEEPLEVADEESTLSIAKIKPSLTKKIVNSLSRRLIPSLLKIIHEQISFDKAHKLNKEDRRSKEKSDMMRIPIALPVVKLLQKLPQKFMDDNLQALILKVCSFLRSTLKQVRSTARQTLNEIIYSLGTSHMETILSHLNSLLSKGFQVHVLSATTHSLLDRMKKEFKEGDVDKIMQIVLNICLDDIFKKFANQENIGLMARKTPEAKPSRKSFLSLNILATNISEKSILDLLMPFKEYLAETQSKKVVNKVQECLQRIIAGLTVNPHISLESLMILSYGTMSESIPDLNTKTNKKQLSKSEKEMAKRKGVDSYLIAPEPKRRGALVINQAIRINKSTNSHILTELGLEILSILLKRKKYSPAEYETFLEPMLPTIVDALKSNFVRVVTLSIKCLTAIWANKLEVPKMEEYIAEIVKEIFAILHKYATNGSNQKDSNFLLAKTAFKSIIIVLKKVTIYKLNDNQIKTLLLYVEQDLYNHDKQTMVFLLLKAIVERKLTTPELHEIMKKIFEISITSDLPSTQEMCRQITLIYLMEYPIEKKIETHIKFFIAQLNYDVISGRQSAIQMLILMFKNFPQIMLRKFSGLFFLSLGARLVNDESSACKKLIADALELLIKQIDGNPKQQLFEMIISLLQDSKLVHREMGAQLCNRFVNAEGDSFIERLEAVFPHLVNSLEGVNDENESGKFVRIKRQKLEIENGIDNEDMGEGEDQSIKDHHQIQTLNTILKIFEAYESEIQKEKYQMDLNRVGWHVHNLLGHEHLWVRINALKIVNFFLKIADCEKLVNILRNKIDSADSEEFLYSHKQIKSITLDMCVQLKPDIDEELLLQIISNLLFVANILKNLEFTETYDDKKDFNLLWLVRRLRYAIHSEIAQAPKQILLRKQIFQYFEALAALIDNETLSKLAISLLNPIIRETVDGEHTIEDLKTVAIHVGNEIKKKIGQDSFDKIRLELQSRMLRKRVDRRKTLAQERIRDPVKSAERKIVKQLKKVDKRKRKFKAIQDGIILPSKKKKISLQMDINEL